MMRHKTRINPNKERLNCADKQVYLDIIASNKARYEAELHAKDEIIEYYRRAAENATRSKHRALDRHDEHRKDIIAYGIFAVCVVLAIWLSVLAGHEFLLWASGN